MLIDIEQYYAKYSPMVYRRCQSLLKNEEEALDVMQDVFVRVLDKATNIEDKAPSSLLYTIATNLSLNAIKKRKREYSGETDEMIARIASLESHTEITDTSLLLDDIFAGEKPSTKIMAFLHYVDGFTLEETADTVGLSVSGVRKRLRKLKEEGHKWILN
jgi:RNA polymerase sigma-70 factor (ECF subfamily)